MTSTPRVEPMRQGCTCRSFRPRRIEGEAGHLEHVGAVVEDGDAGMADQAILCRKGFIVERRIEERRREIGPERSADLNGLDGATRGGAAGDALDDLAERETEGGLVKTCMPALPAIWIGIVPRERPIPKSR